LREKNYLLYLYKLIIEEPPSRSCLIGIADTRIWPRSLVRIPTPKIFLEIFGFFVPCRTVFPLRILIPRSRTVEPTLLLRVATLYKAAIYPCMQPPLQLFCTGQIDERQTCKAAGAGSGPGRLLPQATARDASTHSGDSRAPAILQPLAATKANEKTAGRHGRTNSPRLIYRD
jgi:hypothetical protein